MSPEEVNIGDIIMVKPGERVPLDGQVVEVLLVDTLPDRGINSPQLESGAGSFERIYQYQLGLLTVKVTKNYRGIYRSQNILDLVQNASSKKSPYGELHTKFAQLLYPGSGISALAHSGNTSVDIA